MRNESLEVNLTSSALRMCDETKEYGALVEVDHSQKDDGSLSPCSVSVSLVVRQSEADGSSPGITEVSHEVVDEPGFDVGKRHRQMRHEIGDPGQLGG